jgi:hypothetical protein
MIVDSLLRMILLIFSFFIDVLTGCVPYLGGSLIDLHPVDEISKRNEVTRSKSLTVFFMLKNFLHLFKINRSSSHIFCFIMFMRPATGCNKKQ